MTPPFTAEELSETRKPLLQATQLPPRSYVDEAVADWEAEHLFLGGWVCVGHAQPLAERGRFVTRQIKDESFLFVGDDEGRAHGFFNVCRHRGARLVTSPRARCAASSAPTTPGATASTAACSSAPHTEEIENFDPATSASTACAWRRSTASCSPTSPAPPARSPSTSASSTPHLERYRLGDLHRAAAITYDVAGQLEGDRRELLRVPALPGRAPRAQPPLALHERRGVRGRGRLVRRLDDAHRGRRDDGRQRRPRHAARRSPG